MYVCNFALHIGALPGRDLRLKMHKYPYMVRSSSYLSFVLSRYSIQKFMPQKIILPEIRVIAKDILNDATHSKQEVGCI